MQPGARHAFLPRPPQARHLHGDDHHHGHHQEEIDEEDTKHHLVARHDRRQAGQNQIGGKAGNERQADDQKAGPKGAAAGAGQGRRVVVEQGIERARIGGARRKSRRARG